MRIVTLIEPSPSNSASTIIRERKYNSNQVAPWNTYVSGPEPAHEKTTVLETGWTEFSNLCDLYWEYISIMITHDHLSLYNINWKKMVLQQ